jgi:cytochrome c-type biogenesis protein CcmH
MTGIIRRLKNIMLCGALFLGAPEAASASVQQRPVEQRDSLLEARTSEVAARLRCPVCQGVSIQDSPAELAQEMRSVVREQLRAGKTPAEVEAYFVASYGEWVLLEPRASGLNLLLYLLPVVLVLGGVALVVKAVRRWTGTPRRRTATVASDSSQRQ